MPKSRKTLEYFQNHKYTNITISPKEEEWNDAHCSYPFRLNPGEKLPRDNFIRVTYWVSMSLWGENDGRYESFVKEIKETDADYLAELFRKCKKEGIKRIDSDHDWKVTGYHPDNPNMPLGHKFVIKSISNVKMTERERERERERQKWQQSQQIQGQLPTVWQKWLLNQ